MGRAPWEFLDAQRNQRFDGLAQEELLEALLEDPGEALLGALPSTRYERVCVVWDDCGMLESASGVVRHQQSQAFVRRLIGGRQKSYRLHCFSLEDASMLNARLVDLARALSISTSGVNVSNVGGFHSKQELFECPEAKALRDLFAVCVTVAAHATCKEAGQPSPKEGCQPYAWVNVSGPGHLNQLHQHEAVTLASCYYAQVPPGSEVLDGSILFRLPWGKGPAHAHPDEERHVPWMASITDGDREEEEIPRADAEVCVQYIELSPAPGMLLIFPAWLSHAVAPTHPGSIERISFAANWEFQTPSDDFADGWRWFQD